MVSVIEPVFTESFPNRYCDGFVSRNIGEQTGYIVYDQHPSRASSLSSGGNPQLMRTLPSIPPVHLLGKEIKPVTVAKDLGL